MAIIITDECINCGACEAECPNTAIYEGGLEWSFAEGTSLTGKIGDINAPEQEPISYDFYYIVPDKCTECKAFMKNLNALLYVLLNAVFRMKII